MDKGIMVADSFRSEQEYSCAELALLKELPCEVTSLATPDANLPFQVHCDASDYGVGCCLIQQDTEGIYRPIAFASQNQCYAKELGKHRERGLGSVIRVE
ncbi:hypothetical protein TNCV_2471351 [Trichonephila clavipes]|nr:hypothetical protein TNCV_2471351 [Trichonephila clavipes]